MANEQIDWSKLPALADTYNKLGLWRFADAVIKLANLGDRINQLPAFAQQLAAAQEQQQRAATQLPAFAEAYRQHLNSLMPRSSWNLPEIVRMARERQQPATLSDLLRG